MLSTLRKNRFQCLGHMMINGQFEDLTIVRRRLLPIGEALHSTSAVPNFIELNSDIAEKTAEHFLNSLTKKFNQAPHTVAETILSPYHPGKLWINALAQGLASYARYCDDESLLAERTDLQKEAWAEAAGYCRYAQSILSEYLTITAGLNPKTIQAVHNYMSYCLTTAALMHTHDHMLVELPPWVKEHWPTHYPKHK